MAEVAEERPWVPEGMAEEDVLATIECVVRQLAPSFAFGHYDIEDIKQVGRLEAITLLGKGKYNTSRPLRAYIYTHVRRRLLNLRREIMRTDDVSCRACYRVWLTGNQDGCGQNSKDCARFRKWARNQDKKYRAKRTALSRWSSSARTGRFASLTRSPETWPTLTCFAPLMSVSPPTFGETTFGCWSTSPSHLFAGSRSRPPYWKSSATWVSMTSDFRRFAEVLVYLLLKAGACRREEGRSGRVKKNIDEDGLMSRAATAAYIGCSDRTVSDLQARGQLTPVKVRGGTRFRREEVEAFVRRRRQPHRIDPAENLEKFTVEHGRGRYDRPPHSFLLRPTGGKLDDQPLVLTQAQFDTLRQIVNQSGRLNWNGLGDLGADSIADILKELAWLDKVIALLRKGRGLAVEKRLG